MKTVADVGEFGLIARIEQIVGRTTGRGVVLGIGDDAALLRARADEDVVVSTDAFVERVHFRFDHETPTIAGRRAMVAALSDLAAMGARSLGATLALSVTPKQALAPLLALVRGLVREGARWECPLVGGNVTRSRELALTVTVIGAVTRGRALRRDRARPGDTLFVTGRLGRSALERSRRQVRSVPEPRIAAGRALSRLSKVGGCIDVSDGLLGDLHHLCAASGVSARLRPEAIPWVRGIGPDQVQLACSGGEDYELLFSMRGKAIDQALLARRLGVPVTAIGALGTSQGGARGISKAQGWRHF